ncbi:hypothetical protein ATHL_00444 [Anaerolinea thermolimosa]|nr:hypothetical protein ATHL_00444 [Anaerolinea thermolimosa]
MSPEGDVIRVAPRPHDRAGEPAFFIGSEVGCPRRGMLFESLRAHTIEPVNRLFLLGVRSGAPGGGCYSSRSAPTHDRAGEPAFFFGSEVGCPRRGMLFESLRAHTIEPVNRLFLLGVRSGAPGGGCYSSPSAICFAHAAARSSSPSSSGP